MHESDGGNEPESEAAPEEGEEAAPSSYNYNGRRLFQGAISVIGLIIIGLAVRDLIVGEGARALKDGLEQSAAIEDFNRFLDEGIGRKNIDFFMLAIGSWISFFGLDGVFCRGPQLSFDAAGLHYFRFGRQVIAWPPRPAAVRAAAGARWCRSRAPATRPRPVRPRAPCGRS